MPAAAIPSKVVVEMEVPDIAVVQAARVVNIVTPEKAGAAKKTALSNSGNKSLMVIFRLFPLVNIRE